MFLSGIFEKYTLLLSIVYDFEKPSGHYDSNSADIIALDFILFLFFILFILLDLSMVSQKFCNISIFWYIAYIYANFELSWCSN